MIRIDVGSDLVYQVRQPTVFLFQISAANTVHQTILSELLTVDPNLPTEAMTIGSEGNKLIRCLVQPCELKVAYRAQMQLSHAIDTPETVEETLTAQLPAEVLTYLNPSRYCQSDLLARFAWEEFGEMQPGYNRVQAICSWVFDHLDYTPGSTNSTTTAADVLLQRTGVCRDYAHLAIALCRGIGIPARYVAGYAVNLQPPDFHGFMEAYLDGQWYLFDPTRLALVSGLVRIGAGRDAADLAFATLTGNAQLVEKQVWANEVKSESNLQTDQISEQAVSLS